MNSVEGKSCSYCGSERFVPYSELGFEERIIADSRAEKPWEKSGREYTIVCARCFTEAEQRETRA